MKSLTERLESRVHSTVRKKIRACTQPGTVCNVVDSEITAFLTEILSQQLNQELDDKLGRTHHQRGGDGRSRNGYKPVKVWGFFRPLILRRPVLRTKTPPSAIVSLLRQCGNGLIAMVASRFWLRGASTRAVASEINSAFGTKITPSTVSEFTDQLLPQIQDYMQRPISENIVYLFLDAIYIPVRRPGFTEKQALLCAVGITEDGSKKALGFLLGDRESTDSWSALLQELLDRGLNRDTLRLAISDEHKAIIAAVSQHLACPHQLCVVHKMRNVLARVSSRNRKEFYADFKAAYWADSRDEAQRALGRLEARWAKTYPKATEIAITNSEAFLRFQNEPEHLWTLLRTSNLIERFNREIRRRLNSAGAMQGEDSLNKLLWSVASEQEKRWTRRKVHFVKEHKKAA